MSLTHFAAPCQQLFSRFREVFFIEAVKLFSSARFVKLLKARPLVNNFFSTFRFFSFTRRVVLVARREPIRFRSRCQQLFFSFRKIFFESLGRHVVTAHSLYLSNSRPGRPLSASARREKLLWTLSRQRSRSFFDFSHNSFLLCHFNMLKRRFLTPPCRPTSFFSHLIGECGARWPAFVVVTSRTAA